ncbi:hypothetical protein EF890_18780 [Salmonella enterica]|nr:hypothetical protein [Salmonella enterica]EAU2298972.1 hypothetical protein [Salmonella enterica]EAU5656394.1 hypothetical protein [Salmonella enterica]
MSYCLVFFHVCIWMVDASVTPNRKTSRHKLPDTLRQFEPGTQTTSEACSATYSGKDWRLLLNEHNTQTK